jgi:hypothetical protein
MPTYSLSFDETSDAMRATGWSVSPSKADINNAARLPVGSRQSGPFSRFQAGTVSKATKGTAASPDSYRSHPSTSKQHRMRALPRFCGDSTATLASRRSCSAYPTTREIRTGFGRLERNDMSRIVANSGSDSADVASRIQPGLFNPRTVACARSRPKSRRPSDSSDLPAMFPQEVRDAFRYGRRTPPIQVFPAPILVDRWTPGARK